MRKNIKKIIVALAFSIALATGMYYVHQQYHTETVVQQARITNFDFMRDMPFVREQFKKHWYWLVSEYSTDFDLEYTFKTHSPNKKPEYAGKLFINVLRENNITVGAITYYKKDDRTGTIQFLLIDESVRKKGYGAQLVEHAFEQLARQGVKRVQVLTRTINVKAIGLYKKLGFVTIARGPKFVDFEKKVN